MEGTQITIVRHGETEWNKSMQLQGHLDSPLTATGTKQAEQVAEALNSREFDAMYSSDLNRAIRTAETINKHFNLKINKREGLRERAFGVMEGLTREEVKEKYPEIFHVYMHRNSNQPIPGGETLTDFSKRVVNEIEDIANKNQNKKILLVAHGGVLDCIIRKIFNMSVDEERSFALLNSSINTIKIVNGKWILEEWGNVDHLQEKALNEFS